MDSSNFLPLWTRATTFRKSEYCNIVGRSSLCELVCTHVAVGELAFWNNPADQIGGMPWREGDGPLSKLLSGGDTSTNSLSHPIPSQTLVRTFSDMECPRVRGRGCNRYLGNVAFFSGESKICNDIFRIGATPPLFGKFCKEKCFFRTLKSAT